jgi:hypothetical protein
VVRLRGLVVPAVLAGMLAVTGLLLSRIFAGPLTARLLIAAAVASVAVSVAMRRLPAWSAAPASVTVLAAYAALAVRISASAGGVPGSRLGLARDALLNGVPRLLTAMIPIEPQPDTVLVPVIAVWLAGLAAAELALRSRWVLASYGPPVLLLGGALYLVGPNAVPSPLLPLAFAAFAAVGLAASSGHGDEAATADLPGEQRASLRLRIAGGAAAGLAAILAVGTAVAPTVAAQVAAAPTDPRRYVTPPQLDSLDESPLARLSGWTLDPGQHLFDAELDRNTAARIRLAVLSDYDGVTWRVGGNYRAAGRILSGPPTGAHPGGGAGHQVEQRITIDQLDGRLVPAMTTPERIDGVRVAYDPSIATVALPVGLRHGLSYTVVSRVRGIEVNLLPSATVPQDRDTTSRFVKLTGDVPPDLARLAAQLAEVGEAPYQRAQAVEQFIAEHYQLVSDAPGGHAYPNLNFFLFGPKDGGGQRGTSEQFAAAFAVLGRAIGLPTRVAVGFDTADGRAGVYGRDAVAWPEVLFDGVGWVPFDPLPKPDSRPKPVENDFRPKPEPPPPSPSTVPTPSLSTTPSVPVQSSSARGAPPSGGGVPLRAIGAVVMAVAAACALALVPVLRRRRRQRRLWQGDPSSRVIGAWQEMLDTLRLAGRDVPGYLAASEVTGFAVLATGARMHGPRRPTPPAPDGLLADLADLVNVVTFASTGVSAEQADHAVDLLVRYVAELRSRRSRWRRALWSLDPRPLWWHPAGSAPPTGAAGTPTAEAPTAGAAGAAAPAGVVSAPASSGAAPDRRDPWSGR